MCANEHTIFSCSSFNELTAAQRLDNVRKWRLCTLCLEAHPTKECKTNWTCFACKKRHNTILHVDGTNHNKNNNQSVNNAQTDEQRVVLATAIIRVRDGEGNDVLCRVLIDQGSMTSIITDDVANRLKLRRSPDNTKICGISGNIQQTRGRSSIEFRSRFTSEELSFKTNVVILKKITSLQHEWFSMLQAKAQMEYH